MRLYISDINECIVTSDICGNNAQCSNTVGSYTCSCNKGYTMTEKGCVGKLLNLTI